MAFDINLILLTIITPVAGVIIILLINKNNKKLIRWTTLGITLLTFLFSIFLVTQFDPNIQKAQFQILLPWIKLLGVPIAFHIGIDGLNILLLLLTTFLTPIAILSSWNAIQDQVKEFMILFLMLEFGMLGVFISLDLILFYIFWEFTLVPMYFLIGVWGGKRRIYAAIKFFIYTMAGSIFMLLAIIYMGWAANTYDLVELLSRTSSFENARMWLFLAFALAFAIKVPVWPLHSWLPDAHVEAPTAGSVILAGVLLKMGTYGFLRFNLSLFPEMSLKLAPIMAGLAVIGILYGAALAFAQKDLKKLVAFSSVSHLGFVILGLFALNTEGISGAILQMINHGLSTGALFLIVGMIYERRHTRELADFGGLWKTLPVMGGLALTVTLSSLGLPGLNGFVGEFTILVGAFGAESYGTPVYAILATFGVILAAAYLLNMFEKVFLGKITHPQNENLKRITSREIVILIPIIILIFWIGLYPQPFLELINPTVENLVDSINYAAMALP